MNQIHAQHVIRYDKHAVDWFSALPVGNGRLGGMVYGAYPTERISLNQDSCYWGSPRSRIQPGAGEAFPKIRELIMQGRVQEADDLFQTTMVGAPRYSSPYVPLSELHIRQWYNPEVEGQAAQYERKLDLREGIVEIGLKSGSAVQIRTCFASLTHNVLVYSIRTDHPGGLTFSSNLSRRPYDPGSCQLADDRVGMSMQLGEEGVRIAAVLSAQAFGKDAAVKVSGDCVVVERATEAIFYIAATTSFYDADPLLTCGNTLDKAMEFGYENLVKSHQEAYRAQYTAMKVTISSNGDRTDTTDRRLKHYREGGSDPDLEALFFNYGRYLLISSSQPDSQPANLQGIWNGQIVPPWDSNYTNNINLQMNYWAVEATGLGQLHQPFFDLVKRMLPAGRRAAQEYYGCRGFVFHHNTDLYGDCAVSSLQSYPWTVGSIWLLMHLWDHYDFNRDLAFLKAEVLPLYLEAVTFFQDFLVEDQDGRLITGFSQSPENACVDHRTGQRSMTSDAPAMDSQLLRDLFTVTRKAMHLTGMSDPDLEQYLDEAVKKLPATKIGSKGQLLEWDVENEELSPDHRHKSHLYAAYPSEQITWNTPELMEAVRTSLRLRTSPNRKPDGWTAAWTSALYARLKEASEAHSNYRGVLEGTHPNLFTGFGQVFQIDANLGAAAAFVEMLLQSHAGVIQPLPACPAEWPEGSVKGMRARGGFLVDMDWKDGALMKLTITSPHGGELSVVLPGGDKKITMLPGDTFAWEEAY